MISKKKVAYNIIDTVVQFCKHKCFSIGNVKLLRKSYIDFELKPQDLHDAFIKNKSNWEDVIFQVDYAITNLFENFYASAILRLNKW